MFTRPDDLSDADIVDALRSGWNVRATSVEYVAAGFGSHHWRVEASDDRWFLNVDAIDKQQQLRPALATARSLRDTGLEFVVAPEPAATGDLLHPVGARYLAALYPFLDGTSFDYGVYETAAERRVMVEHLVRLHATAGPPLLRTEDFVIPSRFELDDVRRNLDRPWESGPYAEPARELLARHERSLFDAFAHYDDLVRSAQRDRFVVTHGEPHRANTILTDAGVMLIDWDTAMLAPRERDLWDIAGQDAQARAEYEDRAHTALDDALVAAYRLRWDLAEIAEYATQFRAPHEATTDTEIAWLALQRFLDPARW